MHVLVTGGGGFLGGAIVRRLVAEGHVVRSLQRTEMAAQGFECIRGDIADFATVDRAASGCDTVFHVAAKAGVWGTFREYHRANVLGTENVVNACRSQGVGKLVYTSSPSAVFCGRDEAGIDESAPYPKRYLSHYPRTKAIAEQFVRSANGPSLSTVSLRPHLIWGPGDNHLVPRILDRARKGALRRVGNGKNVVDATYIDNAADAHLLAAKVLSPGSAVAGKAYFISNGEPVPLWELIDRILACGHLPAVTKSISADTAYCLGAFLELTYRMFGRSDEPPMTRFVARQLSTDHWFCLDAARKDFSYEPRVSTEEGLRRLAVSLATN